MARSAEKKQTALARWLAGQEDRTAFRERPKLASDCDNLKDANNFRRTIINEITKKISQIQNPSLGEYKLRDLNDEINRLIRERKHWEERIIELGGSTNKKTTMLLLERDGKYLSGTDGYKYFGAARDLPGVRELFQNIVEPIQRKSRIELNLEYYGYNDEADGVLLKLEMEEEDKVRNEFWKTWKTRHRAERKRKTQTNDLELNQKSKRQEIGIVEPEDQTGDCEEGIESLINEDSIFEEVLTALKGDSKGEGNLSELEARINRFSHVEVPSQKEVEQMVIGMKKDKLLQSYMSDELMQQLADSSSLLGIEKTVVEIEEDIPTVELIEGPVTDATE